MYIAGGGGLVFVNESLTVAGLSLGTNDPESLTPVLQLVGPSPLPCTTSSCFSLCRVASSRLCLLLQCPSSLDNAPSLFLCLLSSFWELLPSMGLGALISTLPSLPPYAPTCVRVSVGILCACVHPCFYGCAHICMCAAAVVCICIAFGCASMSSCQYLMMCCCCVLCVCVCVCVSVCMCVYVCLLSCVHPYHYVHIHM